MKIEVIVYRLSYIHNNFQINELTQYTIPNSGYIHSAYEEYDFYITRELA